MKLTARTGVCVLLAILAIAPAGATADAGLAGGTTKGTRQPTIGGPPHGHPPPTVGAKKPADGATISPRNE
jgi:hypothetical protein